MPAWAQAPREIVVVGVVPSGAELERDKVPYPIQISAPGAPSDRASTSLADYLKRSFSSVSLNDAQNNPLQQDLQFRGFTASPLLGLAQGLSVYQNGARINEPLGDTVSWDLLPQSAVERVTLLAGANPLFGLNSLGGALNLRMKNGFTYEGNSLEFQTGSFGRVEANAQAGGNDGNWAYYVNLDYFEEDGWRQQSPSEALNLFGSLGWRSETSTVNVNAQLAESDLVGNGSSPVELLAIDRGAIFTGPDITANDLTMVSLELTHRLGSKLSFGGNVFYRRQDTDSFNGDGSEFAVCDFSTGPGLIAGLEDDDVEELGLDVEDVCSGQFGAAEELEVFLNATAEAIGSRDEFNLEGYEDDELSGTGLLSDQAVNNISQRRQNSEGADFHWTLDQQIGTWSGKLIFGAAWFRGESDFDAVIELADIDPDSRITTGLGTGTFVDEEATSVTTRTESISLYFNQLLELSERLALTLSARANNTDVDLRDLSGERPELNGSHSFDRINPAFGLTWQVAETHNLFASVSRSSRAPTPIELACNEGVFDLAVQFALEAGEDPEDVEFECRLPNAFLADPPLEQVVARSYELGMRGALQGLAYNLGLFRTTNKNDILFQTTGRQTGLFANVDETRRTGLEARLAGSHARLDWQMAYSVVEATFEDDFRVLSPNHEFADDNGEIEVNAGNRIPGIPSQQFKLSADYSVLASDSLRLGLDVISNGEQYLRGDESNQLEAIEGYTLVNLRARYRFSERFELYARIDNLLDTEFETFGLLGEEPDELQVPIIEDLEIPVFLGAAPPRAGYVGFRLSF